VAPRRSRPHNERMTERRKPRPRDPLQLAKLIGDIATGQTEDRADAGEENAASARARLGGLEGGKARAAKLTPAERSEIARQAAAARWKKS
jgi:hypothetical protein